MLVLEAERGNGEVNTAFFIHPDPVPLNQDVEHRHSVSQAALEILPLAMHDLLEMAHQGQHGQHRFHDHPCVPFATFTYLEIVWMPVFFHESFIGKHDHVLRIALGDVLKSRAVVDVGGIYIPIHDQPDMIEYETQFAAHNPAFVRQSFLPDLLLAAPFSSGMDEFDAVGVHQADEGGVCHETWGPVFMGVEQTEQSGAMGQFREQAQIIPPQPTVKGAIANPLEGKQDGNSDHFAGVKIGLRVFVGISHSIVNAAEQLGDKVYGGHGVLLSPDWFYISLGELLPFVN